jgi:hypothetical protein
MPTHLPVHHWLCHGRPVCLLQARQFVLSELTQSAKTSKLKGYEFIKGAHSQRNNPALGDSTAFLANMQLA